MESTGGGSEAGGDGGQEEAAQVDYNYDEHDHAHYLMFCILRTKNFCLDICLSFLILL